MPGASTSAWLRVSSVEKLPTRDSGVSSETSAALATAEVSMARISISSLPGGGAVPGARTAAAPYGRHAGGSTQRGPKPRITMVRGSSSSSVSKSSTATSPAVLAAGRASGASASGAGLPPRLRSRSTSSRLSLRCSTRPRPHSTTVTALSMVFSRSISSISEAEPSRYASTCTRSGPPGRGPSGRFGWMRTSTKVGRDDAGADAQALPQALGEGGLPRSQLTGEDQQVPGLELGAEPGREGVGLVRGPDVQGPFPGRLGSRPGLVAGGLFIDVAARHPRADPRHDLVVVGAGRPGPVLCGGPAVVAVAKQNGLGAEDAGTAG